MKKGLKDKIKSAFESEMPDFRERVISACESSSQDNVVCPTVETQKKKPSFFRRFVAVATCLFLFVAGLFVGKIIPDRQIVAKAETSVFLDVNPSIELSLDEDNVVLSCVAVNDDANEVLNGMKLEGLELKTALNAIIGSMYVNGKLSLTDNSILISVDTNDASNTDGFLSYITKQINEIFTRTGMECAIIAQGVDVDDDLKRRAQENDISVGKMYLIDKMIDNIDVLTEYNMGQLSNMNIKDLSVIYLQKPNEGQNHGGELITGSVNVGVNQSEALSSVLTQIEKTELDVENYEIRVLPSRIGKNKVVYAVNIKLYGDEKVYRYEVDLEKDDEGNVVINEFSSEEEHDPIKGESPASDTGDTPSNENNGQPPEGHDEDVGHPQG